jgi:hypothetical protein
MSSARRCLLGGCQSVRMGGTGGAPIDFGSDIDDDRPTLLGAHT